MLQQILDSAVSLLWGRGTVLLTLLCGIYFTVATEFLPIFKISAVFQKTVGSLFSKPKSGGISPFAAVSAALGGTMGVGNIIGVGAAFLIGGAGSIFWMWVGAFFGMMTKYAEVLLAVLYRERDPDSRSFRGGPMYYMSKGISGRPGRLLAIVFCIICTLSCLTGGSMTQTNAIACALSESFSVSASLCAVILTSVCAWVLCGGCDRAVRLCSALVPFMSVFYLAGCFVIILHFRENLSAAFHQIFSQAFGQGQLLSKAAGISSGFFVSVRVGISRGIFTHEAGLGSASIAHACSDNSPVEQGFWGIFEVFCDTLLVCTATALAILCSGVPFSPDSAKDAFVLVMGKAGGQFLSLSIALFAFASVISFCLYGQRCIEFLFPNSKRAIACYRFLFLLGCAAGCFSRLPFVLSLSDFWNACLLFPNLTALFLLSPKVIALTKEYFQKGRSFSCSSVRSNQKKSSQRRCCLPSRQFL